MKTNTKSSKECRNIINTIPSYGI